MGSTWQLEVQFNMVNYIDWAIIPYGKDVIFIGLLIVFFTLNPKIQSVFVGGIPKWL